VFEQFVFRLSFIRAFEEIHYSAFFIIGVTSHRSKSSVPKNNYRLSRITLGISSFKMLLAIMASTTNFFGFAYYSIQEPKTVQTPSDFSQQPNMEGVVEVSFRIDSQGKAEILQINATSPKLADYVIKKLAKIQLEKTNNQSGKVNKYRFVFKKQA